MVTKLCNVGIVMVSDGGAVLVVVLVAVNVDSVVIGDNDLVVLVVTAFILFSVDTVVVDIALVDVAIVECFVICSATACVNVEDICFVKSVTVSICMVSGVVVGMVTTSELSLMFCLGICGNLILGMEIFC